MFVPFDTTIELINNANIRIIQDKIQEKTRKI